MDRTRSPERAGREKKHNKKKRKRSSSSSSSSSTSSSSSRGRSSSKKKSQRKKGLDWFRPSINSPFNRNKIEDLFFPQMGRERNAELALLHHPPLLPRPLLRRRLHPPKARGERRAKPTRRRRSWRSRKRSWRSRRKRRRSWKRRWRRSQRSSRKQRRNLHPSWRCGRMMRKQRSSGQVRRHVL